MNARAKSKPSGKNEVIVPDKLYFRIGEVSRLTKLPAYVLRFWETEFPQLKPVKSSTGQRMYRRKDVETALHIKQLLYQEGFTIAGARHHLRSETATAKGQAPLPFPSHSASDLRRIRHGLQEILTMLSARAWLTPKFRRDHSYIALLEQPNPCDTLDTSVPAGASIFGGDSAKGKNRDIGAAH